MWRAIRAFILAWVALHASSVFAQAATFQNMVTSATCAQTGNGDNECSVEELKARYSALGVTGYRIPGEPVVPETCYQISALDAYISEKSTSLVAANWTSFGFNPMGGGNCGFSMNDAALLYTCSSGGAHVTDASQCAPGTSCRPNIQVSLMVAVTKENPSANEYTPVCFGSCEYEISQATIWHDSEAAKFYMRGTWASTGEPCEASTKPVGSGDVEDPNDGGESPGETGSTTGSAPDGCAFNDVDCHHQKQLDSVDPLSNLRNTNGDLANALGPRVQFPSWAMFMSMPAERVCAVSFNVPGSRLQQWIGGSFEVNFCPYVERIDRIGGFILAMLSLLVIFPMFFKTPGAD